MTSRLADEALHFHTIEPYQEIIKQLEAYIADLEEFVKAYLWKDNFDANMHTCPWEVDVMQEHNRRVDRVRKALAKLRENPKDLWNEVLLEDTLLGIGPYAETQIQERVKNKMLAFLNEQGLIHEDKE